jgi:hypothetical protein
MVPASIIRCQQTVLHVHSHTQNPSVGNRMLVHPRARKEAHQENSGSLVVVTVAAGSSIDGSLAPVKAALQKHRSPSA